MAEEAELPPWPNADSEDRFMALVSWAVLTAYKTVTKFLGSCFDLVLVKVVFT